MAMKICLFLILILISTGIYAQQLRGTYRYTNDDHTESQTLTFLNNTFTIEINGDLIPKKGAGTFTMNNRYLLLKYLDDANADRSTYKISAGANAGESARVDITAFDSNGLPLQVQYGCRDDKDAPMFLTFSDKNGIGNMTIFPHRSIRYFVIDAIGYHRISIPIKRILGKMVNITAYLKLQTNYDIPPKTVNYKIIQCDEEKLILREGNKSLTFKRMK